MSELSWKARVFILATIVIGLGSLVHNLIRVDWQNYWILILVGVAAVAQVFKVEGATHKTSYNIGWLVYGFAFLVLGGPATLFIILIAHLIEWTWHKYPWYIQSFNIATFAIAVSSASWVYNWILSAQIPPGYEYTLAAFCALAVFTLLNHLLIGLVIWFARGQDFSQSGVFGLLTLTIDFALLGLGAIAGMIWEINPSAVVFVIVPLYMIYSTLQVPGLQRQTEIDPKTKLFNARFFAEALKKEYDRALRYDRPLTVVIGDLDLLRNINNTYGHLAGDVVLIGVAEVLQEHFRGYDLVARFGGEEFAIMMPETTPEEAYPRVEAVRQAIAAAEFDVSTSVTPIKATISFGIAARNGQGSAEEIVHDADVTLYRSKLKGRNVTSVYSEDDVEGLFDPSLEEEAIQIEISAHARLGGTQLPFQSNPLRENGKPEQNPIKAEKSHQKCLKTSQLWGVNTYISVLTFIALGFAILVLPFSPLPDWFGLLAFSLIVLLTEGLSIDLYVNDTTVSTSAAPLLAGTLLFGPIGALILSLVLAGTALVKHRSHINRFIFNSTNHFITSLLCSIAILIFGNSFSSLPGYVQIAYAILAGNVLFFGSTLLLAGVMSLSLGQPVRSIWTERFRWLWPYYLAFGIVAYALVVGYSFAAVPGVLAVLVPLLMLRFSHIQYINKTKSMVGQLRDQNIELEDNSNRITMLNEELLHSLANVIDLRDPYTFGHSKGVSRRAVQIGEALGLSAERIELLRTGCLLHDIGKIGIPDSILFKPGKLTKEEFDIIKEHPLRGAELVRANQNLRELVPIIRHHHERYDGLGYPDGLCGREIPLEARILILADAIQAMESDRPYRNALSRVEIISEVKENSGTQFDPALVNAYLRVIGSERPETLARSPVLVEVQKSISAQHTSLPELIEA
jgi:diguanylate cyclase (GGDEF)-like protein/putative nucleotidyltransferase with HDIG domain